MNKLLHCVVTGGLASGLLFRSGEISLAASTSKTLSTNVTLVNLGTSDARVRFEYQTAGSGLDWVVGSSYSYVTIPANGGQRVLRQYDDGQMGVGQGSMVFSSDQPLAAVVQVLARAPQVATQGAYVATTAPETTYLVPLVMRFTASTGNRTQFVIQNSGMVAVNATIELKKATASPGSDHTLTYTDIRSGTSLIVDLVDISHPNLPDGWYGSAKITTTTSGGKISVVSNLFVGANGLQSMNGIPASRIPAGGAAGPKWYVPLFASQLSNGFNTVVSVQNNDAASIPSGAVTLACGAFSVSNNTSILPGQAFYFNPVISSPPGMPTNWTGACTINSSYSIASFTQLRLLGTDNTAAVEGISILGSATRAIAPFIAQTLANGLATAVTVVNKGGANASVEFRYVSSNGAGNTTVTANIPPAQSVTHNHGVTGTPNLPNGWEGTLTVVCTNGQPIEGFVQLKNMISGLAGDNLMTHPMLPMP